MRKTFFVIQTISVLPEKIKGIKMYKLAKFPNVLEKGS